MYFGGLLSTQEARGDSYASFMLSNLPHTLQLNSVRCCVYHFLIYPHSSVCIIQLDHCPVFVSAVKHNSCLFLFLVAYIGKKYVNTIIIAPQAYRTPTTSSCLNLKCITNIENCQNIFQSSLEIFRNLRGLQKISIINCRKLFEFDSVHFNNLWTILGNL